MAQVSIFFKPIREFRIDLPHRTCSKKGMPAPKHPVTVPPERIEGLRVQLCETRHNVNNQVSLILAAAELIRQRPDQAARFVESLLTPPERIVQELKRLSDVLEQALEITPG
jgi:hypothetical protein